MPQPKSSDYQIRFAGALFAGFTMAAVGWWAMESGFRIVAASAVITFVLIWLYALITWVLWRQARGKSRHGSHDET